MKTELGILGMVLWALGTNAQPALPHLAVPSVLVLPAPSPISLTVAWDAQAGASGYNVYWGTKSGVYTNHVDAGSGTQATLNLLSGSRYFMAATSYNAQGLESAYSAEVMYVALPKTNIALYLYQSSSPSGPWTPTPNWIPLTNPAAPHEFYQMFGTNY